LAMKVLFLRSLLNWAHLYFCGDCLKGGNKLNRKIGQFRKITIFEKLVAT